ncbi:MAG: DUF5050 domain-containing protein [bacterium]|nr:DUF5050 domain-containing protein [bacterium]
MKCEKKNKRIFAIGIVAIGLIGIILVLYLGINNKSKSAKYEREHLANTSANLYNNGLCAEDDNYIVYSKRQSENQIYIYNKSKKTEEIIEMGGYNFCIKNDRLYYIGVEDNKIYEYTLENRENKRYSDYETTQFQIKDDVFFTLSIDKKKIIKDGEEINIDVEKNINKFDIMKDKIYYLTNNTIYTCNTDASKQQMIREHVLSYFIFCDKLVCETDYGIEMFNLSGDNEEVLIDGDVYLLGARESEVYYSNKNMLYSIDLKSRECEEIEKIDGDVYQFYVNSEFISFQEVVQANSNYTFTERKIDL